MIGKTGIIGLCILKMKNEARCSIADKINKAVIKAGYKLVWFTYFEESNCMPEVSVTFGMLDKTFIDALIVCAEDDEEGNLSETVVKHASGTGIPIVSIGKDTGMCPCVKDYESEEALTTVINLLERKLTHVEKLPIDKLEPVFDEHDHRPTLEEISLGEDKIYSLVNRMLDARCVKDLVSPISEILPRDAYFCFNGEFIKHYDDPEWDEEKYKVIPSAGQGMYDSFAVSRSKVLPESNKWIYSQDCYILTPAISKDVICGYYAYRIHNMEFFKYRCRSIARFMNIALNVFVKNMQNKRIIQNMEGYLFLDANTGLPNLKGVSKWFKETALKQENHEKRYVFTIYSLPKYSYILETYGADVIEDALRIVAARLQIVYDRNSYIAKVQSDEFVVINTYEPDEDAIADTRAKMKRFYDELEKYHRRNLLEYFIDVNSGYAVADPGWTGTLEAFVKYAANDMYLQSLNQENGKYGNDISEKDKYGAFDSLIRNNLINYHLQPIIDAKTGDIYGYEALMRSAGGISLSPLEILDIAKENGRLDELEHATMFNAIKLFFDRQYIFQDRKLFMNTIPGHFLTEEDINKLKSKYGDCLDNIIFEVTEQDSITDEELAAIRNISNVDGGSKIAIDDYGAGHSNIVNLLRYTPQIIKIDRYLIADIQNDINKQMFVKSTIEFAAMNNIKVLAEGVETFDEMQAVIEYGVDLIQGYYIARPNADVIDRIPERIRREVLNENLRISSYNRELVKIYNATDGETINLINLAMKQYTYIALESGKYYISGDKNSVTDMHIKTIDGSKVDLTFIDVNMRGATETPIIMGKKSELILRVSGVNTLNKEGIQVPEGSMLCIKGDGDLIINLSRNYGIGIGGGYKNAYGSITVDMAGTIDMSCSGDRVVGIGGERSDSSIKFIRGNVVVNGTGISILDIGSVDGVASVEVCPEANLDLFSSGNDSVALGGIKARANLLLRGKIKAEADGERAVAIGSLFGDDSSVLFADGNCNASIHCDSGAVLGTYNSKGIVKFIDTHVDIYGEGGKVTGLGSVNGQVNLIAESGDITVKVLSGMASPVCSRKDTLEDPSGIITIVESEE